ncbi:MAG: I78 family peptidase inhibitor [Pseudomonadota bacterium]|nr:I78 family peptidase inhibitor [Pseudomonadota bacterium]
MIRFALIPVFALTLAACQTDSPVASAPVSPGEPPMCAADEMQSLVGQDISNHPEIVRSRDLRVLEPGSVMTMDYRSDRLNIETDEAGIIVRVFCG